MMDEAIDVIKKQFSSLRGELHSLSYTSDDACNNEDNIAWMNELEEANDNKESFTQCISFDSSFRSPKNGGGAWNANEEYTWSWWLARSEARNMEINDLGILTVGSLSNKFQSSGELESNGEFEFCRDMSKHFDTHFL